MIFPFYLVMKRLMITKNSVVKIKNLVGNHDLLSRILDDVTNYKIYVGSTSKGMTDREKKRGRRKYKNLKISRTKRAF